MSRPILIAAAAPLLILAAAPVVAQQKPAASKPAAAAAKPPATTAAAPASAQSLGGPAIPGVCELSQEAVLAQSKIARAANVRLGQLEQGAQAEVSADRTPIDNDAKALQANAAKMAPADVEKQRQSINTRLQVLQDKVSQRNREIQATQQKVLTRISTEAQPIIAQVYKAHGCGLLLARTSVLGGNMAGDLTVEVVRGLDAKISTISFDREILPPGK